MKFEDITAPQPKLSPEMRYASLHRSIENGLATDRTWAELIDVCLHVGRHDEACGALRHIREFGMKRRMLARLHTRGLLRDVSLDPAQQATPSAPREPARSVPTRITHTDLTDLLGDSVRFLFLDHMPLTVIVATVTFPLVVGVGGLVTSGASGTTAYFLLSLVALIPALTAIGLVGALGRQVILDGHRGLIDPPHVPTAARLAREAVRFLGDSLALGTALLGPGIALLATGLGGLPLGIMTLLGGIAVLPLALALRQVREDWKALDPRFLARKVLEIGPVYPAVAGIAALAFAPAALGVGLTSGSALYMRLSVAGPMMVAPLFIVARLVGLVLHQSERRLSRKRGADAPKPSAAQPTPATAAAPARRITKLRLRDGSRPHPETARPTPQVAAQPAPQATSLATPLATPLASAQPTPATPRPRPAPSPSGRRAEPAARPASAARPRPAPAPAPRQRPTAAPAPAPRQRPAGAPPPRQRPAAAPRPAPAPRPDAGATPGVGQRPSRRLRTRAESGTPPTPTARPSGTHRPDPAAAPELAQIPGARVLRGAARVSAGAAARPR